MHPEQTWNFYISGYYVLIFQENIGQRHDAARSIAEISHLEGQAECIPWWGQKNMTLKIQGIVFAVGIRSYGVIECHPVSDLQIRTADANHAVGQTCIG